MAPFYGWGSTASRLEPLRGCSLLFTTKFPEIPVAQGGLQFTFKYLKSQNEQVLSQTFSTKPHKNFMPFFIKTL